MLATTDERPAIASPATESASRAGSPRLSLRLRIFLLIAVLLGLAVGSAVWVSVLRGAHIAEAAVQRALEANAAFQNDYAERQLREIQLKLQLIAADAPFVKYIADAQGDTLGLGDASLADAGSIQDLLLERQDGYGFALGIVLNGAGEVLANTEQQEALQQSLADDPFVRPAIDALAPFSSYWRMEDRLYQAAIMPLAQADNLVGFLLIAEPVDDAQSAMIGQVSQADIAYLLPVGTTVEIVGSSLDAQRRGELATLLSGDSALAAAVREARPMERLELELGGSHWVGRLKPLDVDAGGELGAALQLSSVDAAAAGYRSILNAVALAGLIALLVAIPLSLLLTRASLRPLTRMAQAAEAAAAGDYQTRIAVGGRDELAQLSNAFDSLLSDLRGERDIESYVTHLSRLLPDPGEDAPAADASPPRRCHGLLLAIERRGLPKELQADDADTAWQRVGRISDAIADAAFDNGGEILSAVGARWNLLFTGEQRLDQALRCLTAIWQHTDDATAAISEGELLAGTLEVDGRPTQALLGIAQQQADLLLADSGPGQALLPRPVGDAIKQQFGDAFVEVARGHASGKAFYALTPARLATLPAAAGSAAQADPADIDPRSTVIATRVGVPRPKPGRSVGGDLRPGTRFGGRYQVLSVLGTGGMGVVYKARDLELDDIVALKMLKPAALADAEHLERLKSEIRLARRITHPNVLRTFDFGEHDGLPYISMEYVRGMTLRYLIGQAGRVPYTAALRIARQLCAGLQAAHEVGVLHRDIKPENLILEASGNAKLMDFGIARPIRRTGPGQTDPGMYVGTPNYSAPEQLAGKDVDHRADIYACGVLMCEMFSGHLPYQGDTTIDLYMTQMNGTPVRPSTHWPDIPPVLEALILRCIAIDINARYPDVASLAADLGRLRA